MAWRSAAAISPAKYSRSSSRSASWDSVSSMNTPCRLSAVSHLVAGPGALAGPAACPLAEQFEPVISAADKPGQVADHRGVPVQRVADVQANSAMQMVTGPQCRRPLLSQPVGGDVGV